MKKILIILIIISITLLTGCSDDNDAINNTGSDDDLGEVDVVEIDERFFLTQIMHITRNADEYIGRTIRYEGMFQSFYWPASGFFYMVNRNTWGCCGEDGMVGFEVNLGDIEPLADNAWVEVYGVLEWYVVEWTADEEHDREPLRVLRVAIESLTELDERGEEFVSQ